MAEQQFNLEDLFSGVISANIYSKEIPQFKINEISEKTNVGIKLTNRLRNDELNPTYGIEVIVDSNFDTIPDFWKVLRAIPAKRGCTKLDRKTYQKEVENQKVEEKGKS